MHMDILNAKTIEFLKSINYNVDDDFTYCESFSLSGSEINFPELNIGEDEFVEVADSANLNTGDTVCCVYDQDNIYAIAVLDECDCTIRKAFKIFKTLH